MTAYTLFSQANLGIGAGASARLTIGCEFEVSQSVGLTGIWWFAPTGTTGLPSQTCVFDILAASIVTGTLNTSPSWSGAGANAWNKVAYDGSVTLVSGKKYQVAVFADGAVAGNWFASVAGYWTTGPGASGIANGPLSAPNNASSNGGQDMVQSGGLSITLPNISENGKNYGVDVEVTVPSAPAVTGGGLMSPLVAALVASRLA